MKGFKSSMVDQNTLDRYLLEFKGENVLPWQKQIGVPIVTDENVQAGHLEPSTLFDRKGPTFLEIGCGNGDFLLHLTETCPEANLIGIEISFKMIKKIVWRLNKRNLSNVRIYPGQAETFLEDHIKPGTISRVHIHFPDPWPKKRHHKRRIYNMPFLKILARAMVPGGKLITATDYEEYGYYIRDLVSEFPLFEPARNVDMTIHEDSVLGTNFEKKGIKAGSRIYYMEYIRV
ncbi:MAG: tRNA (guanosine(46)-N7)-methyltransferase TrmB [Candidatus Wallbacteria bacterium HGW-Wallbacteria-1]|jgi:tRNA (guanine-N7-)-methyltransferase|uniref:tRNA (guanine-N(7)-)-methyltransferase n=1 Tax=Candidatus Wallbacteria bacterium HGW-Wallbacteria-1 TaxID=2013854 RepID=A0A2N1PRM9_9BACT|nr:MAG: tRNA (guanosine(46)-N7)-methyltransferase TrmB [Candidatus Wallbacteria bacterium HGW-Wallbacteria-1]